MYNIVKCFQVQYDSDPDYIDLLTLYKKILENANAHNIIIQKCQDAQYVSTEIIAKDILKAITNQKQYTFCINKNDVKAKVVFLDDLISLYPEPPLIIRLHVDEAVGSPDYMTYFELLLALCEKVRIYGLETIK